MIPLAIVSAILGLDYILGVETRRLALHNWVLREGPSFSGANKNKKSELIKWRRIDRTFRMLS
jgi:hypothetical protein